MAKYKFTKSQFDELSLLLKRRPTESRDEQKKTRAKIRKLGFMISDYFSGFTNFDFEKLLDKGEIEIIDKQSSNVSQTTTENILKQTISKLNRSITKQALPPVVDKRTEFLVLGTMPGEQSLLTQEYYKNPRNQFWKIIAAAFNNKKAFADYNEKITILKNNKIGLWDVPYTCDREGQ